MCTWQLAWHFDPVVHKTLYASCPSAGCRAKPLACGYPPSSGRKRKQGRSERRFQNWSENTCCTHRYAAIDPRADPITVTPLCDPNHVCHTQPSRVLATRATCISLHDTCHSSHAAAQSQSPLSHSCLLFIVSLTPMPDFPAFEDGEAPPDFGSPLAPPFPTALTLVRHRAEPSDFRPSFHRPRT